MSPIKRVLIEIAIGVLIGFALWSFIGPTFIGFWYTPPSQHAFSCADAVKDALSKFVKFELAFAVVGGVGLTLLLLFIRRAFARSKSSPGTTPQS